MAILAAFSDPSIEVLALTTTYGNAEVETCTKNACYLCDATGNEKIIGTSVTTHLHHTNSNDSNNDMAV